MNGKLLSEKELIQYRFDVSVDEGATVEDLRKLLDHIAALDHKIKGAEKMMAAQEKIIMRDTELLRECDVIMQEAKDELKKASLRFDLIACGHSKETASPTVGAKEARGSINNINQLLTKLRGREK